MSATFAPIDAATITALNGGSEQALETIYRSNYNWLLARALERLKGEDAAAPRLLIATLREFWAERDGIHTSGEIEAFFNEELRHRARATRARMAAVHRFEKAEGVQALTDGPTFDLAVMQGYEGTAPVRRLATVAGVDTPVEVVVLA